MTTKITFGRPQAAPAEYRPYERQQPQIQDYRQPQVVDYRQPVNGTISTSYVRQGVHQSIPIREQVYYQSTDKLYRPIKDTLTHPQIRRQHAAYIPEAAKSSQVSHKILRANTKEIRNIEDTTLIPNAELEPENDPQTIERVRREQFVVMDAQQKVYDPISQEELERRRAGFSNSQVVYKVKEPREEVIVTEKIEVKEKKNEEKEVLVQRYDSYVRQDYKYNVFSCLDRPINECRLFGCGKCTGCPGNEVIASEQNRSQHTVIHYDRNRRLD